MNPPTWHSEQGGAAKSGAQAFAVTALHWWAQPIRQQPAPCVASFGVNATGRPTDLRDKTANAVADGVRVLLSFALAFPLDLERSTYLVCRCERSNFVQAVKNAVQLWA